MSDYRRWYRKGGTYFFTLVTFHRRPLFLDPMARSTLHEAMELQLVERPFTIVAIVLLPNHLHTVWTLPRGDHNFSVRWQRIKEEFTERFLARGGVEGFRNASRKKHRERAVWQRRFWEHLVRDENDLDRCVDYIHWNPRKHGLVARVRDWPYSTFHRFVAQGHYDIDWGGTDPCPGYNDPEWGEPVGWAKVAGQSEIRDNRQHRIP